MSPSTLGYLRSTSRAPGLLLALLVVFGFAALARVTTWRGDWWWGYNSLAQGMPLAVVLVAFLVGWEAGANGSGLRAVSAQLPVARWQAPTLTAALPLGAALAAYLLGVAVVASITLASGGSIEPRALLVVLAHAVMLVLAAVVGLVAGRWLAAPYAAVSAAVVVGALLFFTPGAMPVFGFLGSSTAIIGGTPSVAFYLVDLSVLAVMAAALSLALVLPDRVAIHAVAAGTAVVAWLGASLVGPTQQFVLTATAADRCGGDEVTVCVYPGYDRLVGPASAQFDALLQRASEQGVQRSSFPSSFRMQGGPPLAVGEGYLLVGDSGLRDGELDEVSLAESMSAPLWCPAMFAEQPPVGLLDRRQVVFDWLLHLQGFLPETELVDRHPSLAGDAADRAFVVSTALADMRACTDQ